MEENTKPKKLAKTRTSITIDPGLLTTVRNHCEEQTKVTGNEVSVSSVIEKALSKFLEGA